MCFLKDSQNFYAILTLCIHHAYFLSLNDNIVYIENTMLCTLEYVHLRLMQMIFQDYVWVRQSFLSEIQDLHK